MREYFIAVLTAVITVFFVYYSIVMSNAVMVHLNHMFVEAQTICTNMIMRIENCEGFKEDEDVVLIGALQYNNYYQTTKETNAEILKAYLGPGNSNNVNGVNWGSWLSKYMTNILNSSLQYTYYDSLDKYQRDNDLSAGVLMEIKEMPSYPLLGSVKKIDNTIYVNLGELGE